MFRMKKMEKTMLKSWISQDRLGAKGNAHFLRGSLTPCEKTLHVLHAPESALLYSFRPWFTYKCAFTLCRAPHFSRQYKRVSNDSSKRTLRDHPFNRWKNILRPRLADQLKADQEQSKTPNLEILSEVLTVKQNWNLQLNSQATALSLVLSIQTALGGASRVSVGAPSDHCYLRLES